MQLAGWSDVPQNKTWVKKRLPICLHSTRGIKPEPPACHEHGRGNKLNYTDFVYSQGLNPLLPPQCSG